MAVPPNETPEERLIRLAETKERKQRTADILGDPEIMTVICAHIANGGSLIELAKLWNIRYSDAINFIRTDADREKLYGTAINDRTEWAREIIKREILLLASTDMREAFDVDGSIKDMKDWPEHLARAVSSYEPGKIKLADKLKALESYGKIHGLYVEKHEVAMSRLEDLIGGSLPINGVDNKNKP
jgi:hypothetical protein